MLPYEYTPSLSCKINKLKSLGCRPNISKRGNAWRAHVNRFGNFWSDSADPEVALDQAIKIWEDAGKPLDGEADKFNNTSI